MSLMKLLGTSVSPVSLRPYEGFLISSRALLLHIAEICVKDVAGGDEG